MIRITNATLFKIFVKRFLQNSTFNVSEDDISNIMDYNNITDEGGVQADSNCGGAKLQQLAAAYAEDYHSYLSICVCIFGTVANILNIAVLTRKDMASAPINRILTALAVADMLLMIEYISFAYYYHFVLLGKRDFPYYGAVFILLHNPVTQILHTISVCLTLTLAVWRYLAIGYPEKNHTLCSDNRCTLAIIICYMLPVLLCFPSYNIFEITTTEITEDGKNYTLYHTSLNKNVEADKTLLKINFWLFAVFIKLLPCIILTIISCWLIRTLFKAKKRKQVLRGYDSYPLTTNGKDVKRKISKAERRADRTTKMLIAVLLLFLITEFPQGIFAFFIGLKGKDLFLICYQQYGEVMDIMALLNGSINFILYCCMNRMFRATFGQLFKHKILAKWSSAAPPSEIHTTTLPNGTNTTTL